jgi:uncharacterized RDD family membrane protein YckC
MLASFAQREWSSLFDAFALVLWLLGVALLHPWPAALPGQIKALIWFGPPLFVEPVSVWVAGRTAGQTLLGLRVIDLDPTVRRIGLLRAIARHFTKMTLLGLSPLYVPFSSRGQAIHDALFHTTVVVEPLAADFHIPVASPVLWGPFLTALVVATVSSFTLAIVLGVCIGLSPLDRTSSPLLAATADLVSSLAASAVFLSTVIRRGQKARARAAA